MLDIILKIVEVYFFGLNFASNFFFFSFLLSSAPLRRDPET